MPPKKTTPRKRKTPAKSAKKTVRRKSSKRNFKAFEEYVTYGLTPVLLAYIILSHIFPAARLDRIGSHFSPYDHSEFVDILGLL